MGWDSITNGELIRLAEADFDVFVTSDQNIRYQQNLSGRRIAICELSTTDLRRILSAAERILAAAERILAAAERILAALEAIKPGDYIVLEIP